MLLNLLFRSNYFLILRSEIRTFRDGVSLLCLRIFLMEIKFDPTDVVRQLVGDKYYNYPRAIVLGSNKKG